MQKKKLKFVYGMIEWWLFSATVTNGKGRYRFKPCCSNYLLFFQVEDWSYQCSPREARGPPWEALGPWDPPCYSECTLPVPQGLCASQEKRVVQLHSASPPKPPTWVLQVGLGLHQFICMGCLSERGSHHLCLWRQALIRIYTLLAISSLFWFWGFFWC